MVFTLKETKAKLSEMVSLVQKGEEIIITVRGEPKARLTAVSIPGIPDRNEWGKKLLKRLEGKRALHQSAVDIVRELREDRF